MKNKLFFLLFILSSCSMRAQITDPVATEVWSPEPRVVTPGAGTAAPSDAIVLFDGSNLNEWMSVQDSSAARWNVEGGAMTVNTDAGDIMTKRVFGDCQLHVEFSEPEVVVGEGQNRGNSGIFLQNRYEVQVLDCYQNRTYSNGQTASIYKQSIPLVNACRPPGQWQYYDIIYTAPRFNTDGIKVSPGFVTVLHNGVLVQNHTEIKGTTEYIGLPQNKAHGKGAIKLQDHDCLVKYRNIWIREL